MGQARTYGSIPAGLPSPKSTEIEGVSMWGSAILPSEVDLSVDLPGCKLPNPIVAASGTFGYGDEVAHLCDPAQLGAVTTKSIAHFECAGNAAPRLYGLPFGMINSVGLPGLGVERFVSEELPRVRAYGGRLILSLWGRTIEDYRLAAKGLAQSTQNVIALEVNLACPNTMSDGRMFAQSTEQTKAAIAAVKEQVPGMPLFAKLTPHVASLTEIVQAAVDGGATGVTLTNTFIGMPIDAEHRKPILGNGFGGVSGSGIRPLVMKIVSDVSHAFPNVPIIGTGGVMTGQDAAEMLMVGAAAVGVGTATFLDPRATLRIIHELRQWCAAHGVRAVRELIGTLE